MDIEMFSVLFTATSYQRFIVVNIIHTLKIILLPVVEIQNDDAYVLIDAMKIIS